MQRFSVIGWGDNVRSGLPLQLMENNGVLKKLSPSTVNSDFCDKLEEYYNNSKKGKKKENLIFLVYNLDKALKDVSEISLCFEKSVEELMPYNTNFDKTQILLFPKVRCRWEHKSQGRCYKNNLENFIEHFIYVEREHIKGIELHHYIISPSFFRKFEKKKALKIAVSPITDQDVLESEEYQRDGNIYFHINLHSAAFQLAAQIVMKVFQLSTLCCKIVYEKLHYKAREEEL